MSLYQALNSLGVDNALTILGLIILSIQDLKYGEIHYRYLLLIVGFSYKSAYIILVLILLLYKYVQDYIGGADLLIFVLLISKYGYYTTNLIVLVSSISALFYSLLRRKKKIRFIPFIFIATIIVIGGVL